MEGVLLMDDGRQRIDRLAIDEDLQFLQFIGTVFEKLIIERGIALGSRFQIVEEIHDDLRERDLII